MLHRCFLFWSHQFLPRRLPLLAIAITYFVLSFSYSLATPLNEGPDEIWHYLYVRHIAEGKGLPMQDPRGYGVMMSQHEASQAPLYYLVAGLLTSLDPHHRSSIGLCREPPSLDWASLHRR